MKSLFLLFLGISVFAHAQDPEGEINLEIREDYQAECKEIKEFVEADYSVACNINYHHYNTRAYKDNYSKTAAKKAGKVRIGTFNVLHPETGKARFKDYRRIAELIDGFDVIGVTELLPLVGDGYKNNAAVVKFLEETPGEIKELKDSIKELKSARQTAANLRKQAQTQAKIKSLEADLKKAADIYRKPGYLKILDALHARTGNKDWALLLSPRGEAAKEGDVQELVGFYYRSTIVKPKVNQYCREIRTYGRGTPFACIPNFGAKMLGESKADIFSRRPFLAEFISGDFSFVLLASHVIYTSPSAPALMSNILDKAFGVTSLDDLGTGANKGNYARFAEVKVTLDLMEQLRTQFNQKDVILLGDLNLEYENKFWESVLPSMPGANVYVSDKTSVSPLESSGGFSKSYDHFVFDETETDECIDKDENKVVANVVDFYSGRVGSNVRRSYLVRNKTMRGGKYTKNATKYKKVAKTYVGDYENGDAEILTIGTKKLKVEGKTVNVKGIINNDKAVKKFIDTFYERVLDSQFDPRKYFEFYKQVMSDHMPITMSCSTK